MVYQTQNTYEATVKEAFFSFLVLPCQDQTQRLRTYSFSNSLEAEVFHHSNPFGFDVTCLRASQSFTHFEFCMKAVVEKSFALFPYGSNMTVAQEQALLHDHNFFLDYHLFLGTGRYTQLNPKHYPKLLFRGENQTVYEYLQQLNNHLYQLLEFDPEPTHVCTTANEVLEIGRGVCQDFTHLFIGIARLNKIPCRYVSGYLNQGLNLTGTAVMHAWAEAYIPGFGWQGFDPTNNLLADVHYIKAAHGTDYNDCSPIKGMLRTNGGHTTDYGVKITPLPEPYHNQ